MNRKFVKLITDYNFPTNNSISFELYLQSLEMQLYECLPESLKSISSFETFLQEFNKSVPILNWFSTDDDHPMIFLFSVSRSEYGHGTGRFIGDICSRWLVPGKQLPLANVNSMVVRLKRAPSTAYFMTQLMLPLSNSKNLKIAKSHIEQVIREIRISILSVQHARSIVSLKTLSNEQKKIIIRENLASLFNRPAKDFELNIFDQMHHFFLKVQGEERLAQVRERIASLHEMSPQVFERDLFNEIQNYVMLFKDSFTAQRELKHITRIISYMYLFRKNIETDIKNAPNKRHMSLKILKSNLHILDKSHQILGILIGINLLRENERFAEKHIVEAIKSFVPGIEITPDSCITDRKTSSNTRILYLEIQKRDLSDFTTKELKTLRQHLPMEIKSRIESVLNPVFMPRNDEEIMQNILTLSKQLKYVHDIPQVIITFHQQTEHMISFTVILLRILKSNTSPLKTLFATTNKGTLIGDLDAKVVGMLRKKYPKEANVFEVQIEKKHFLRKDFSLDLYEARKRVLTLLMDALGDVRDYNGGMISKQSEVYKQMLCLLQKEGVINDFLLKNFFYSLTPIYMQSLLPANSLKDTFLMLMKALDSNFLDRFLFFEWKKIDGYLLVMIAGLEDSFKELIDRKVNAAKDYSLVLTSSNLTAYDIHTLGYILRSDDDDEKNEFISIVQKAIDTYQKKLTPIPYPIVTGTRG